jgi:hypothetical protein
LNKVEKAKLFEWCTAHEVGRTTGRARMRAVTEVVASAQFHLVMDREKDKYFSIGTEYRTAVMQSLTSGNLENLLKTFFKTYIVGMQLQKDENGNEYPCRREGLGKDSSARQLLLDEAAFVYYQSTIIGDTDSLSPSSAALETAKLAKTTKRTRSEIQQKASKNRFADSVAKKAKRESRLLAEAAREDAATQAVRDVGVEIAKAMNQGNEIFASLVNLLASSNLATKKTRCRWRQ